MPYLIGCSRCDAVGEAHLEDNLQYPKFPEGWSTLTLWPPPEGRNATPVHKWDLCPNCKLELGEWASKKVTRTKKK